VKETDEALAVLTELGLNELEAEVYVFLLGQQPMTAYRVARHIGKATANTYKAIDSLARRGAVLIEEGENRLCRAVPAAEFIQHVQRSFSSLTRKAEDALSRVGQATWDERVYKVESAPQLLERCRQMLEDRLESVVVIDAFPAALNAILPSITHAVQRKKEVLVQAYTPVEIRGAEVVVPLEGGEVESQWGAQQLNVVIDGREALIALLNNDLTGVIQAVWTNSLYLSCMLQAGMLGEQTVHRLRAVQNGRNAAAQMKRILDRHRFFLNTEVPGQKELLARFVRKDRDAQR
jgi:sugar-specific transcriptional regulator TrmB